MDVDAYCTNRPGQRNAWDKASSGFIRGGPGRLQQSSRRTDNQGDRVRLSTDTRFQPADERWIGPNPPGHGRAGKRGRIC